MLLKKWSILLVLLTFGLVLGVACQPAQQVVEVTRVVRETDVVTVEGTPVVVEVTRVVTEVEEREVVVEPEPAPEEPVDRNGAWLDTVVVIEEPSADAAVTRLEVGDIDLYAFAVANPAVVDRSLASPDLGNDQSFGSYDDLTFNPVGPVFESTGALNPFAVPAIREAMNWLIDREYVAEELYGGLAVPRWVTFNRASGDYAAMSDLIRAIEVQYSYDLERAREVISAEMENLGAEMVDGVWQYNGAPVEIIFLIRTEDTRLAVGDYISNQLEDIGFTVVRDYKTAAEAGPIWIGGEPADGLWHLYTGGWVSTVIPRDLGGNFAAFYTDMGRPEQLWQAYQNDPAFYDIALKLNTNDFATLEERRELIAQALEMSLADSNRIWIVDRAGMSPRLAEVSVAADLYSAVYGSWLWPHTMRREGEVGGSLRVAMPSILTQPWNALDGSNWVYDAFFYRGTGDYATLPDPYTGLWWPQRVERGEVFVQEGLPVGKTLDWVSLEFVPEITVPEDAWADWDAAEQRFITVGELHPDGLTSLSRTVVHYPPDLYDTVRWHDGSPFSVGDVVMYMILRWFDRAQEESAIFDASQVPGFETFMAGFKAVRIVSQDPLVIETYHDDFQLDAETNFSSAGTYNWWPNYRQGPGAWHSLALGILAETNQEAAFSSARADELEVEHLSYIAGPTIEILDNQLTVAMEEGYIPYAATLSEFITPEEAAARYENLAEWKRTRGHYWIGTGAFYLERAFPVEGTVILQRNPEYPDPADKWAGFAAPAIAEVEVDGPGRATIGEEATYDVFITFEGEPYPVDDIAEVKYLVLDAANNLVETGVAEAVEDGLWQIVLDSDLTSQLEAGSNRLEVIAVSRLVALPSADSLEFVTAP